MVQPLTRLLLVIFIVFLLLYHFPILTIANVPSYIHGIPVFFVYLFVVWVLLIFAVYVVVKKMGGNHGD